MTHHRLIVEGTDVRVDRSVRDHYEPGETVAEALQNAADRLRAHPYLWGLDSKHPRTVRIP